MRPRRRSRDMPVPTPPDPARSRVAHDLAVRPPRSAPVAPTPVRKRHPPNCSGEGNPCDLALCDRSEHDQAIDRIGMVAGVAAGGHRAPGMRDDMKLVRPAFAADMIDDGGDLNARHPVRPSGGCPPLARPFADRRASSRRSPRNRSSRRRSRSNADGRPRNGRRSDIPPTARGKRRAVDVRARVRPRPASAGPATCPRPQAAERNCVNDCGDWIDCRSRHISFTAHRASANRGDSLRSMSML